MPYGNHGADTRRPAYRPRYRGHGPGEHHGRDHDRDHRGRYASWALGSYGYPYPGWVGYAPYPFIYDPGFDDWSDTDQGDDQGGYPPETANAAPEADQAQPYPEYGASGYEQPYAAYAPVAPQSMPSATQADGRSPQSAIALDEPLTVIFKGGRAQERIQNYMISSNSLIDLDKDHYEQIPLDQIDVAATRSANRSHGLNFQIPVPSGD